MTKIPGYYKTEELADYLGVSPRQAQRIVKDRASVKYELRGAFLIPDAEVERLANEERKPGPKPRETE